MIDRLISQWLAILALLCLPVLSLAAAEAALGGLMRLTATGHPMQYWISLPTGWHPGGSWPVVVALEAAEKAYQVNAERFVAARGDRPFIIVVPYIVTNGNQGLRDPAIFPYTAETWDLIDRITGCRFDTEGLARVLADVQRLYQGRERCYLTGFEAGTHLLWAYTFQHPEQLAAVAPVAGNYRGRCVTAETFPPMPPARRCRSAASVAAWIVVSARAARFTANTSRPRPWPGSMASTPSATRSCPARTMCRCRPKCWRGLRRERT